MAYSSTFTESRPRCGDTNLLLMTRSFRDNLSLLNENLR
jgi:BarA-like signal transduction histidine kinase